MNGPGGGPWHPPSQVYTHHFKAGSSFQPTITPGPSESRVLTWSSQMGYWTGDPAQTGVSFLIERNPGFAPSEWAPIGTVVGTTAATATFTDPTPPPDNAFYRLKYRWSTP